MTEATRNDEHPERYIAIGDIHGCISPLQCLIQKINPTEHDKLIFLGDYVDRGPDPKGVIDFLIQLQSRYDCIFLSGNHEVLMLDYFAFGESTRNDWARNGGETTLDSYTDDGVLEVPESHVEFLKSCLPYYNTNEYFFVHGGIKPNLSVAENLQLLKLHDFVWERSHLDPDLISNDQYKWEKTVVCGHTPLPKPLILKKLIAIDTGCVYNQHQEMGRLTAISLPDQQIFQIDNRAPQTKTQRFFSKFHL